MVLKHRNYPALADTENKPFAQQGLESQSGSEGAENGFPGQYHWWDPVKGEMVVNISGSGAMDFPDNGSDIVDQIPGTILQKNTVIPNDNLFSDVYGPSDYHFPLSEDFLTEIRSTFFMHKEIATAALVSLYTIVFILGLVGNCLVIYVFAKNRQMRTVTNSFLVNLAVCDLMVVCMCMPFSVALEIYANWIYGDIMCKMVTFIQGLSVISSILTLTVISAERFYAIRRPLKARAFMSRTRIQTIITIIWILSGVAVFPTVFVRKEELVEQIFTIKIYQCVEHWGARNLKHAYNFALLGILYMGPVIFICVGYLHIGLNLWRSDSMLHASNRAAESDNARANLYGRRRVARMLFVLAILFALSWLPYHVMSILMDFLDERQLNIHGRLLRHIHSYALWLGHTNSSINPICYCIMSSSFKSALQCQFRNCCCSSGVYGFRRDSFVSMSMSVTVSTSNSSGKHPTTRVFYRPVASGSGGVSPDLLKDTPRIKIDHCD